MAPPDLASSLMKIFKIYYEDIKTKHINYDDMNFDGQRNKGITKISGLDNAITLHDAYFRIQQDIHYSYYYFLTRIVAMHPNKVVHEESTGSPKSPRRGSKLNVKRTPEDKIPIASMKLL